MGLREIGGDPDTAFVCLCWDGFLSCLCACVCACVRAVYVCMYCKCTCLCFAVDRFLLVFVGVVVAAAACLPREGMFMFPPDALLLSLIHI